MTSPPVRETDEWIRERLGDRSRRILEVGCGDGALARALMDRGHEVVALDASAEAVRAARARGVPAQRADWPDYRGGPFDVVLFGRSLHHMEDLDEAVRRAAAVLRAEGRVLVEDFSFHEVGPATVAWFRARLREVEDRAPGSVTASDGFAARIAVAGDPVEAWHRDADHLHPADRMRGALTAAFVVESDERAPYLYRYVEGALPPEELEDFLARERAAIAEGRIVALGRRFSGRKRPEAREAAR